MAQKRRSPAVTRPSDIVRIDALTPDPANRREHTARNLAMVADSLRQVGAARSIVIDEDDVILAGNGVTEAAATVGITQVRVVEADGEEIIAVRRRGLTPEQKRALAIFDNRTAELAEWKFEQLAADQAAGLDLQPFFTENELQNLGVIVPSFEPASEEEQGRLDQKTLVTCPSCGHAFTP